MSNWFAPLEKEFRRGGDRAYAIVAASMLEELLGALLSAHFVPCSSAHDTLFDGPAAPLGTLSARIDFCHRTGLISDRLARDLHLVRKIRNEFAHNMDDLTFESSQVKNRISELTHSHGILERNESFAETWDKSPGSLFFLATSWMAAMLSAYVEDDVEPFEPAELEWGYDTTVFDEKLSDAG